MEPSKTRKAYPLHWSKMVKKTIVKTFYMVFLCFVAIISGVQLLPETAVTGQIVLLIPVFFIVIIALEVLYFKTYDYELGDELISIEKGVITRRELSVLYKRIQDVYCDQDILDRIMGLYDVHISSATAMSGISAHIDGLAQKEAWALRDEILAKLKQAGN